MKHIMFISNLKSENDVIKIKEALEGTRVAFDVVLENQCIVINGSNDIIRAAKISLNEAGFIIK